MSSFFPARGNADPWFRLGRLEVGTTVAVAVDVYGKDLGDGLYGQEDTSATFTIGRSMIAEIDEAEAYAGVRTIAWATTILAGLGLTFVYSGGYLLWRRSRQRHELAALQAERAAEARFRVVFEQAPLGIALLDAILSDDPTALIGLPLIRTARLLRAAGLRLP